MCNLSKLFRILGIFILVCSLTGCIGGTSQKSSYYVFTASEKPVSMQDPASEIYIGVGPVKIPEFLDRPEVVTRQGKNSLFVNDFHRWGDSLESQTTYVLTENLSALLNTYTVITYPWEKPFTPEYQLHVDFRRFDGELGGSLTLEAMWWLVKIDDDKRIITRRTSITMPAGNGSVDAYVSSQNIALERLSRKIAQILIQDLR